MTPADSDLDPLRLRVQASLDRQGMMPHLGVKVLSVAPGTVEYKINFLAAFQGGELRATGRVVKGGKRIIVTTAEVVHVSAEGQRTDCAVMQQTLVPVPKTY
jgi:acyl-coenzyme A thioesterase PaaI-like protein